MINLTKEKTAEYRQYEEALEERIEQIFRKYRDIFNLDRGYIDEWKLEDKKIYIRFEYSSYCGDSDHQSFYLPIDWLYLDDEELSKAIQKLYDETQAEKDRQKKKELLEYEKRQREHDLAQYNRLKKMFGE